MVYGVCMHVWCVQEYRTRKDHEPHRATHRPGHRTLHIYQSSQATPLQLLNGHDIGVCRPVLSCSLRLPYLRFAWGTITVLVVILVP